MHFLFSTIQQSFVSRLKCHQPKLIYITRQKEQLATNRWMDTFEQLIPKHKKMYANMIGEEIVVDSLAQWRHDIIYPYKFRGL